MTALFLAVPGLLAAALVDPLALQEMGLALWLIAKVFDGAATARLA